MGVPQPRRRTSRQSSEDPHPAWRRLRSCSTSVRRQEGEEGEREKENSAGGLAGRVRCGAEADPGGRRRRMSSLSSLRCPAEANETLVFLVLLNFWARCQQLQEALLLIVMTC